MHKERANFATEQVPQVNAKEQSLTQAEKQRSLHKEFVNPSDNFRNSYQYPSNDDIPLVDNNRLPSLWDTASFYPRPNLAHYVYGQNRIINNGFDANTDDFEAPAIRLRPNNAHNQADEDVQQQESEISHEKIAQTPGIHRQMYGSRGYQLANDLDDGLAKAEIQQYLARKLSKALRKEPLLEIERRQSTIETVKSGPLLQRGELSANADRFVSVPLARKQDDNENTLLQAKSNLGDVYFVGKS